MRSSSHARIALCAAAFLSFFLFTTTADSGAVYSWGSNFHGLLGLGDDANRTSPVLVSSLSRRRVTAVACGENHSAALLETGELFAWGNNQFGQLGVGVSTLHSSVPTQVRELSKERVTKVACGAWHTLAVVSACPPITLFSHSHMFDAGSGRLFSWGRNNDWQLAHAVHFECFLPRLVKKKFFHGARVSSVACGRKLSMALLGAHSFLVAIHCYNRQYRERRCVCVGKHGWFSTPSHSQATNKGLCARRAPSRVDLCWWRETCSNDTQNGRDAFVERGKRSLSARTNSSGCFQRQACSFRFLRQRPQLRCDCLNSHDDVARTTQHAKRRKEFPAFDDVR